MHVVKLAIEVDADYLFWIDDDTICPPDAFPRLFKTLKDRSAAMVTGHYFRRGWPYHCVWAKYFGSDLTPLPADAGSGVHELDFCGLGCALVDFRWLVKNVKAPYFTMMMDDKSACTDVTDDQTFCRKIREAGGLILGDADVDCEHLGRRTPISRKNVDFLRKIAIQEQGEQDGNDNRIEPGGGQKSEAVEPVCEGSGREGTLTGADA
jgi:hypothetical protein